MPKAYADFIMLDIHSPERRHSHRRERRRDHGRREGDGGDREGIFAAPEGGAALAAYQQLLAMDFLKDSDRVVLFNTGSGYKYLDVFAKYWGVEAFQPELDASAFAQHRWNYRAVLR